MEIRILFISITGNTRAFVHQLQTYAESQSLESPNKITLKEIDDNTLPANENQPFFAFVPTYLEGGNGVDNGDQEILTESLREYLEFGDNAALCLGIVGSGNKNFNNQYCLTAKQYAAEFDLPLLADYELRGTSADVKRIYDELVRVSRES